MNAVHEYKVLVVWTGNQGMGTSDYRAYGRGHTISAPGKPAIAGSADSTFHGDADRWNPEELLLSSLSQCHMLSYLHVAVKNGVTVVAYTDDAAGSMEQTSDGRGRFLSVTLHPHVTITDAGQLALAESLHAEAARQCFIAASVNFPVEYLHATDVATV